MASEQVKEVLDNTQKFHLHASVLFSRLAMTCKNERLELLLNYLSSHEQSLADSIAKTVADIPSGHLNTWLQSSEFSASLNSSCQDLDSEPTSDSSFDELLVCALNIDEQVVGVYRDLAQRGEPAWVQDLFQNLLDMEQAAEKQMAKQAIRGMDL